MRNHRSRNTIANASNPARLPVPIVARLRHQKKKKPLKNQGLSLGLMPSAAWCS